MGKVLATADIGSNTAHLLVATASDGKVESVADENEWLGLGEIVAREGKIPQSLQAQLVKTLIHFRMEAKAAKAEEMYIFATEAMRLASNKDKVLKQIHSEVGIAVDIISGQREAELCLAGVMEDAEGADEMIVAEVGGGSAQVAFASGGKLIDDASLPLGTGTLSARFNISFPCREETVRELTKAIRKELGKTAPHPAVEEVVCSGGVARGIWRALHPDGDRAIAAPELEYLIWTTQRLTVEQIEARFSVKPRRAATLLTGALIYHEILRRYVKDRMLISRFGVREGAIQLMAQEEIEACPL